eukprot:7132909-Prymnesium_polylepis.1
MPSHVAAKPRVPRAFRHEMGPATPLTLDTTRRVARTLPGYWTLQYAGKRNTCATTFATRSASNWAAAMTSKARLPMLPAHPEVRDAT